VFQPEFLTVERRHVQVDISQGICRGRTVVDMRRRTRLPEPNASVAVDIDADAFRRLLIDRLRAFSPTSPEASRLTS
jgi:inosine-uridine nucleoside N-ribohydrolase